MTDVVSSIFAVFTAIIEWFVTSFTAVTTIFYTAGNGLTFVGVLTLCALGIAVTLLLINLIRGMLRFR